MAEKPTKTSELAAKMRAGLNERVGKEVARTVGSKAELLQVKSWVEMPEYFTIAVGGKGFPAGHISQIVGDSDSGKSTLLMMGMKSCQGQGGITYLVDSEHKFDFERFRLMGGVPEDIITISVDSLEEAWDSFDEVCAQIGELREEGLDVPIMLAWDSVAASVPDRILEADAKDHHIAVDAKINNINVRKLRKRISKFEITAVFINHTYWTMPTFGISKEVVKGGSELFFMSSLILKTKRRGWLQREVKGMKQKFGIHGLLEVFKGHLGGRKTQTEFYIVDRGILPDKETLDAYKKEIKGKL